MLQHEQLLVIYIVIYTGSWGDCKSCFRCGKFREMWQLFRVSSTVAPKRSLDAIPAKYDDLYLCFGFYFSYFLKTDVRFSVLSCLPLFHQSVISCDVLQSKYHSVNNLEFGWVPCPTWVFISGGRPIGLGCFSSQWIYALFIVRFPFCFLNPVCSSRMCPTTNILHKGVLIWGNLEEVCIDVPRVTILDDILSHKTSPWKIRWWWVVFFLSAVIWL